MFTRAFSMFLLVVAGGATFLDFDVDPSEFVYVLFRNRVLACAGVGVGTAERLRILVPAHCVYRLSGSLDVQLGTLEFNNTISNPINEVNVHPFYTPPSFDYDIAVLKPKHETTSEEAILELSENKARDSAQIVTKKLKSEQDEGYELAFEKATIEATKSCQVKLQNHIHVSSKMVCANFKSVSALDGSPLIVAKNKLGGNGTYNVAGIGSYNVAGNKKSLPSVFTNFANPEIKNYIKKFL